MLNYNTYVAASILCAFCVMNSSCEKGKLTKATEEGANTFSCLIDGKAFKPCRTPGSLGFGGPSLYGGITTGVTVYAGISARCHSSSYYDRKNVAIYIEHLKGVGEYPLSNDSNRCVYEYNYTYYDSRNTGLGKIVVTKDDRVNRILSGRFEFTGALASNRSSTAKVTSGRFDIKY